MCWTEQSLIFLSLSHTEDLNDVQELAELYVDGRPVGKFFLNWFSDAII